MWIFFCLRNTDLFLSCFGYNLTQGVYQVVFIEDYVYTHKGVVIISHRHIMQVELIHVLLMKILLGQCHCDFPSTIRTEVEAQNHISVFYGSQWEAIAVHRYNGLYKFIGDACFIRFFNGLQHIGCVITDAMHHYVIGKFHALPSLVAIHRIVSANNARNLSGGFRNVIFKICQITNASFRIGIPAISKSMDENVLKSVIGRNRAKPLQVIGV